MPFVGILILGIYRIEATVKPRRFPPSSFFAAGQETSLDAIVSHFRRCKSVFDQHRNQAGYPVSSNPGIDPDTNFWAALAFADYIPSLG